MILMWSCPGNMPKYYPGLRDILPTWTRPHYYIIITFQPEKIFLNKLINIAANKYVLNTQSSR